jgi:UDP-N-acetyl-D-mannosaminuronate dehydrogenase
MREFIREIENKTARIGVIGLGYTGLPLAVAFAKKFNMVGYDINDKTVNQLQNSKSHIEDVEKSLSKLVFENSEPEYLTLGNYLVYKVKDTSIGGIL